MFSRDNLLHKVGAMTQHFCNNLIGPLDSFIVTLLFTLCNSIYTFWCNRTFFFPSFVYFLTLQFLFCFKTKEKYWYIGLVTYSSWIPWIINQPIISLVLQTVLLGVPTCQIKLEFCRIVFIRFRQGPKVV